MPASIVKQCKHPCCGDTCRKLPPPKKNYYIKRTPLKKTFKVKPKNDELEEWFQHRINTCQPKCENCGAYAPWINREPYLKLFRAAQAHILPKKNFKSIAAHPLNGFVLFAGYTGVCSCHDQFDQSWRSASQMPIFPKVVERVKMLLPFIAEEEKRFIPEEILKHLQ